MGIHINHPVNEAPDGELRYSTDEVQKLYKITGFSAPYVTVERLSDGVKGTMEFNGMPRYYFNFRPE